MTVEPIRQRIVVAAPPAVAFQTFTAQLGDWWPRAYTFAEAELASAVIEPREGGRWLERTRAGEELPWGRVVRFEPPKRVVVTFAIGADRKPTAPAQASEVEVTFSPHDEGTAIELEHRAFERHGESAATLRDGLASPQGWPLILAELRRGIERAR